MDRSPPYLVGYAYKGEDWTFTFWAESWEDAELRLRAIADNGQVMGSDAHTISGRPMMAVDNTEIGARGLQTSASLTGEAGAPNLPIDEL